jgi:hypothetical protein
MSTDGMVDELLIEKDLEGIHPDLIVFHLFIYPEELTETVRNLNHDT